MSKLQNHDCQDSRDPKTRRNFLIGLGAISVGAQLTEVNSAATEEKNTAVKKSIQKATLEDITALLKGKEALTWVITGDSITHGAKHTLGWRSYPEHFAERVRWELRRYRDIVINTGISGDRTGGLLNDFEWRALRFQPHVISIMIGMNDATAGVNGREIFRQNLRKLADRTFQAGAIPLLNTPNTIFVKNASSRSDIPAYAEIVREVAADANAPLIDHWKHWEKKKPNQDDLLAWLEDNSIHPGVYGHREFAKLIFQGVGIYDEKSATCQLKVP